MTLVKNQHPERKNFSSVALPVDRPDFLDIQLRSFQEFFQLDSLSTGDGSGKSPKW
jgi:DNA-directed RNA polymerase subunit beta